MWPLRWRRRGANRQAEGTIAGTIRDGRFPRGVLLLRDGAVFDAVLPQEAEPLCRAGAADSLTSSRRGEHDRVNTVGGLKT